MKRDKVLIVTSKDDTHADYIISTCNDIGKGPLVVRLNTEDFVNNCSVSFDGDDFKIHIVDSNRLLFGKEIKSVWYRRPVEFDLAQEEDEGIKDFIRTQATAFLRGAYFCCHDEARWINPLPALHRSRIKLQQVQFARKIGFLTPKTLVTNIPDEAIEFARNVHRICTKSLEEPTYVINGQTRGLFTRVIEDFREVENSADAIRRCPVLLQEYIEKIYDLRVVVFGSKLYAFEIHSQAHPLSVHDFRGIAPNFLEHRPHKMPDDVSDRVIRFVREQGLRFSALDFVLSTEGNYVFLENNANGQWLWLQFATGVNLTEAMIEMLFESNSPFP